MLWNIPCCVPNSAIEKAVLLVETDARHNRDLTSFQRASQSGLFPSAAVCYILNEYVTDQDSVIAVLTVVLRTTTLHTSCRIPVRKLCVVVPAGVHTIVAGVLCHIQNEKLAQPCMSHKYAYLVPGNRSTGNWHTMLHVPCIIFIHKYMYVRNTEYWSTYCSIKIFAVRIQ